MKAIRILAGTAGAAILACVAHAGVTSTGGYASASAPLMIALGAGLGIGAMTIGHAWTQRRFVLGCLLVVGLLAGEAYALLLTAERTVANREAGQAPLRAAAAARVAAAERLSVAEATLTRIPADGSRLRDAIEAHRVLTSELAAKVATKFCASECRAAFEKQIAAAATEIEKARTEIAATRATAATAVDLARQELAALPTTASVSPLADRLGVAAWQLDLAAAGLLSIAANGLGAFLLAFGAHGRREAETAPQSQEPAVAMQVASDAVAAIPEPQDCRDEAGRFAVATFAPCNHGAVDLRDIPKAYIAWASTTGRASIQLTDLGRELNALFNSVGLKVIGTGPDARVIGIAFRDNTKQIAAPRRAA